MIIWPTKRLDRLSRANAFLSLAELVIIKIRVLYHLLLYSQDLRTIHFEGTPAASRDETTTKLRVIIVNKRHQTVFLTVQKAVTIHDGRCVFLTAI